MEAVSFWDLCKITVLSHVDRIFIKRPTNAEKAESGEPDGRLPTGPGSQGLDLAETGRRGKASGGKAVPDAEPLRQGPRL